MGIYLWMLYTDPPWQGHLKELHDDFSDVWIIGYISPGYGNVHVLQLYDAVLHVGYSYRLE